MVDRFRTWRAHDFKPCVRCAMIRSCKLHGTCRNVISDKTSNHADRSTVVSKTLDAHGIFESGGDLLDS